MSERKPRDGGRPVVKVVHKGKRMIKSRPVYTLGQVSIGDMDIAEKRPGLLLFTMLVIYDNLYLLGLTLLRRSRRFSRKVKLASARTTNRFHAFADRVLRRFSRITRAAARRFRSPFVKIREYYLRQKPFIEKEKAAGEIPWTPYLNMAWYLARMFYRLLATVFNYAAPVAAALFLLGQINQSADVMMGLRVSYVVEGDEVVLGYVESEKDYEMATQDVRARLLSAGDYFVSATPKFVLEEIPSEAVLTESEDLATAIIQASGVEIDTAYGFYVGGRLLGALKDKDAILNELDAIKKANASGKPGERFEFDKSIALREGLFPTSSIVDFDGVKEELYESDTRAEYYEVQPGDTPSGIAAQFGIPYDQLKEMNPNIGKTLQIGSQILVAVERPYLSVKTIYTDTYNEEFDFEEVEIQNATYAKGYREIEQPGVKGVRQVTAEVTTLNGIKIDQQVLNSDVVLAAIPQRVIVGINDPKNIVSGSSSGSVPSNSTASSSGFIWPTAGGYISCYLGGYAGHTGIDIADKAGAPIYAAASGVVKVSKAGWTGYGHYIVIDHQNGFETYYAHNSVLYVSVGEYVEQGQVIALMGRTGRASGNHVHFEVRQNGKVQNPVHYVGSR